MVPPQLAHGVATGRRPRRVLFTTRGAGGASPVPRARYLDASGSHVHAAVARQSTSCSISWSPTCNWHRRSTGSSILRCARSGYRYCRPASTCERATGFRQRVCGDADSPAASRPSACASSGCSSRTATTRSTTRAGRERIPARARRRRARIEPVVVEVAKDEPLAVEHRAFPTCLHGLPGPFVDGEAEQRRLAARSRWSRRSAPRSVAPVERARAVTAHPLTAPATGTRLGRARRAGLSTDLTAAIPTAKVRAVFPPSRNPALPGFAFPPC